MQRQYLLFFFILTNSIYIHAQNLQCGTSAPNPLQWLQYQQQLRQIKSHPIGAKNEKVYIPIKIHINQKIDGTGGVSMEYVREDVEQANELFSVIGVEFVICGSPNYLKSSSWYETGLIFTNSTQNLFRANDYDNHINIYYNQKLKLYNNSDFICGFAYFPYGEERIFMDNDCTGPDQNILIHELGHYFYLFHTHGLSNSIRTKELVDGSNCESTGDRICDTPADPNLNQKVSDLCRYKYTNFEQDANGEYYEPMVENHMSYTLHQCRNSLTPQQLQAADYFKNFGRRNLLLHQKPELTYFEGLPKEVDVSDLPFFLQTYPEGGTLTGTGIVDGYFDPIISGPGTFTISYQYDGIFPEKQLPDQSQQIILGKKSLKDLQWQSFRPFMSGTTSKIDVLLNSEETSQIAYSIRKGEGIDGEVLSQGIFEVASTTGNQWRTLFFESPISIQADFAYTLSLQKALGQPPIHWAGALWDNPQQSVFLEESSWHEREQDIRDTYNRGRSSLHTIKDFGFVSYVTTQESACSDESSRNYTQRIKVTGEIPENGRIFPNPVKDLLKINYRVVAPIEVSTELFDIQGKTVYNTAHWVEKLGRHTDEINVDYLPRGIYVCRMRFGEEEKIRKVMVGY